jgi:hypothetical protein
MNEVPEKSATLQEREVIVDQSFPFLVWGSEIREANIEVPYKLEGEIEGIS